MHNDILTNYGRLLFRMQRGGFVGALRSILFYQGEADNGDGAQYQANFTAIRSAWLQDYPSIERLYVFQERESNPASPCGNFVARMISIFVTDNVCSPISSLNPS